MFQILDATFDDILPLAMTTMPSFGGLVRNIIRDYFNLNIAEQLNRCSITILGNFMYENIFNRSFDSTGIMAVYCLYEEPRTK